MNLIHTLFKQLRGFILPLWVALNTFVAGFTVLSGYGGYIDQEYMPFVGIITMTFPIWFAVCAGLLVVDFIVCRPTIIAPLAALIIAIKPFLVFCPLNFGKHKLTPEEQSQSFKILSYNTLSFVDQENLSTPDFNRTMHEILASDADILVLLEYENQGKLKKFVPKSQIDSLNRLYPYFKRGKLGTVMFSKRPILHITPPENVHSRGSIEAFRTQVASRPITVFGVHLESIGLTDNDKDLYREITSDANVIENGRTNYRKVRTQLINKLYNAFKQRAWQAKMLRSYAEQVDGDVVICGDFNDIPNCRTMYILKQAGMKDAYAETALGPTITFNTSPFYFRIDHVLWRGNLHAVDIKRGDVASSDHYPFITTFVWDSDTDQRGTND